MTPNPVQTFACQEPWLRRGHLHCAAPLDLLCNALCFWSRYSFRVIKSRKLVAASPESELIEVRPRLSGVWRCSCFVTRVHHVLPRSYLILLN